MLTSPVPAARAADASRIRVLWTAKPGSGCTTVAIAVAAAAAVSHDVLLVDLAGDLATAVGLAEPRHGVTDWLAAPGAGSDALTRLERPLDGDRVRLLPYGSSDRWAPDRADALLEHLGADGREVVVDVGTVSAAPGAVDELRRRLAGSDDAVLVTRSCYLALRRARISPVRPRAVLLVREERRTYDRHEVAEAIGAPVVAQVDHDPTVARRVDAGQLLLRCPRRFRLQAGGVLR